MKELFILTISSLIAAWFAIQVANMFISAIQNLTIGG